MYKPRRIKPRNDSKRTIPIKKKKEEYAILRYWLRERDQAQTSSKYYKAYRNYIILLVGFNSAFRIEDLLQQFVYPLNCGYVSFKEFKTGKTQNFRIKKELQQEIEDYAKEFNLNDNDYLFARNPKEPYPLTRQQAYKITGKTADGIQLRQKFSPHSMRKTFAYQYYLETGKLLTLQKMLNHTKPDDTLRYIDWDNTDIENDRENIYISGVTNQQDKPKKRTKNHANEK